MNIEANNEKIYLKTPDKEEPYCCEYTRFALAEILDLGFDPIITKDIYNKISRDVDVDIEEQFEWLDIAEIVIIYIIDWLRDDDIELLQECAKQDLDVYINNYGA